MNSNSSLLNPQKECIPKDTIPVKKKRAVFTKEEDKFTVLKGDAYKKLFKTMVKAIGH